MVFLDLPFLPPAKLSLILAVESSVDPLITELRQCLLTPDCQDVPVDVLMPCQLPKLLYVHNINSATFKNNTHKHLRSC